MKIERARDWLVNVFSDFAHESEIHYKKLKDNQIALNVESDHRSLSPVFQIQADQDGYEQITPFGTVPANKRGDVAKIAISKPFREISPFLPPDDDRMFLYSSRSELLNKTEEEVRECILDDMGRIAGYDNEMYPLLKNLLDSF